MAKYVKGLAYGPIKSKYDISSTSIVVQHTLLSGVSETHHANVTTAEPIQEFDALEDSDTSSDDEETLQEVTHLLHSHKATRDAARFLGMAVTTPSFPAHCTGHVNVDPGRVHSLASCLTPRESVVVADGGCDTGLLGTDWYVLKYTN